MAIRVTLDRRIVEGGLKASILAERIGITAANLFVLRTGRARAIRFQYAGGAMS